MNCGLLSARTEKYQIGNKFNEIKNYSVAITNKNLDTNCLIALALYEPAIDEAYGRRLYLCGSCLLP